MASEYLKWKYRDVERRAPVQMTPAERRRNWWHYHKWHVAIAVVIAAAGVGLLCTILGVGKTRPDYQVAYVGSSALPDDTAAAIESAFSALGEDLNGDGVVAVDLHQYVLIEGNMEMAYAVQAQLIADLMECQSYFFLLEDPEGFQLSSHVLCRLDGSLPADDDDTVDNSCLLWGQCPALAEADLGGYSYEVLGQTVSGSSGELVGPLYLARRGFWTGKTTQYPEGCAALWDRLTQGAAP